MKNSPPISNITSIILVVRIYVRPYINGSASGLLRFRPAVFSGSGSASAYIYIKSGKMFTVDELRVRIVSPDQSVIIDEFLSWLTCITAIIKITGIHGQAGNYVSVNTDRTISYNYSTTEPEGVRIYQGLSPMVRSHQIMPFQVLQCSLVQALQATQSPVKSYNKKLITCASWQRTKPQMRFCWKCTIQLNILSAISDWYYSTMPITECPDVEWPKSEHQLRF